MISSSCEPSHEELDGGEVDHREGGRDGALEVLGQAPIAAQPREGSLHHPPAWQDGEAAGAGLAGDDLEPQTPLRGGTGRGLAPVAAVGEDQPGPGEAPAQPAADQRRPVAILDAGGVDHDDQQQAESVDQDVPLAPVHLLAGIVAPRAAGFGGPHALAVDDAGRGRGLPPGLLARGHDQQGVERRPGSVLPQAPEVAEHRALGRELLRQEAPRTPGPQQVEDGVEHLAQIHLARPAEPARRGEVRREQRELGVRQVGGVARGRPGITAAGRRRSRASLSLTVWQPEERVTRCFRSTLSRTGTQARRGHIPALRGNDGTWRVQVPAARAEAGHLPDQATRLAGLERDVARLGEQLARAEAGRDAAIAQAKADAQVAIAQAERAAAVAEAQAAMLRETVADLRVRLDRAETRLTAPWWRRLLGT